MALRRRPCGGQCRYVRFPRIFRGVEYGPKYAIFSSRACVAVRSLDLDHERRSSGGGEVHARGGVLGGILRYLMNCQLSAVSHPNRKHARKDAILLRVASKMRGAARQHVRKDGNDDDRVGFDSGASRTPTRRIS